MMSSQDQISRTDFDPAETAPVDRLESLMQDARDLPTIPLIAVQVAQLVDNVNVSASKVATALTSDQALTAKVLRMANSAFYGAPRRVSTVTDAIVLLGMQTIRDLAMAVSCYDTLDRELRSYALRRGDMWHQAFCVAYASQMLAKRTNYQATEEAFIAGLLHDIGKVVIGFNLEGEFSEVVALARTEPISFIDAERRVLGFDHAEVGAKLTEGWRLPQQLVDTIRYHHCPSLQPTWSPLTGIVHVAEVLCLLLGIGIGTDGLQNELEPGVLDRLALSHEAVEEVMVHLSEFTSNSEMIRPH